jgi:ubiquinone/menaquinone biosynthesis C-methylase UbiE
VKAPARVHTMTTPDERRQKYFTLIAPTYSHLTGNTTRDNFASVLSQHELGLTSESIVHDSAAGPGTAASVLIPWCEERGLSPRIVVTDYIPGMIQAFDALRSRHSESKLWQTAEARVVDSLDLSEFPDGYFTHQVDNFSLSTFGSKEQQSRGLREAYRTLAPGGLAVFLTWKRFPVSEFIEQAQAEIKGEAWAREHRVPINGPEYLEQGYLAKRAVEAGWPQDKVQTSQTSSLLKEGEDWNGLFEFLQDSPPAMAGKRGMSEEEVGKWPEAIRAALQKEKETYGGIFTEAWVVLARK